MLVDTASQYGVGGIYLLAGWFNLVPIGYGTLGFLSGAAQRACLRRRVLRDANRAHLADVAASTMLIAVIVLVSILL